MVAVVSEEACPLPWG